MPLDDMALVRCLRNRTAALQKRNTILNDKVKLLETQLQKMKDTVQSMTEEKDARIESTRCPVCLELYSEATRPIIIGCGHTLCRGCTQRLIRPSNFQEPGFPQHQIVCVNCRLHSYINPTRLPTNYSMIPGYYRQAPQ